MEKKDILEEIYEKILREIGEEIIEEIKSKKEGEKEKKKIKKIEKKDILEEIYEKILGEIIGEFAEEIKRKERKGEKEREKELKEKIPSLEKIREEVYQQLLEEISSEKKVSPLPYAPEKGKEKYWKDLKELEEKFRGAKEIKTIKEVIKKARECESEKGKGKEYKIGPYTAFLTPDALEKFRELSLKDLLLAQMVIAEDYRKKGRDEEAYVMLYLAKNMLDKSRGYILKEEPKSRDSIARMYEMLGKRFIRVAKKVKDSNLGFSCVEEAKKCFEERESLYREK
jgi:hypothetical protein